MGHARLRVSWPGRVVGSALALASTSTTSSSNRFRPTMLARVAAARALPAASAAAVPAARGFHASAAQAATLRELEQRIKSVSNIEKITKSMKMIAATQLNKAQRAMEAAHKYGNANQGKSSNLQLSCLPPLPLPPVHIRTKGRSLVRLFLVEQPGMKGRALSWNFVGRGLLPVVFCPCRMEGLEQQEIPFYYVA